MVGTGYPALHLLSVHHLRTPTSAAATVPAAAQSRRQQHMRQHCSSQRHAPQTQCTSKCCSRCYKGAKQPRRLLRCDLEGAAHWYWFWTSMLKNTPLSVTVSSKRSSYNQKQIKQVGYCRCQESTKHVPAAFIQFEKNKNQARSLATHLHGPRLHQPFNRHLKPTHTTMRTYTTRSTAACNTASRAQGPKVRCRACTTCAFVSSPTQYLTRHKHFQPVFAPKLPISQINNLAYASSGPPAQRAPSSAPQQ